MAVVSNTSPLSYLLIIGEIDLLPRLFTTVHVPEAVLSEITSADAPLPNQAWGKAPPAWLKVQNPTRLVTGSAIHVGESNAISLALELRAERLIIDDFAARDLARSLGIPIVGLLGILDLAADRGLLDLPAAVNRLIATNFRISHQLVQELLQRDAARKRA